MVDPKLHLYFEATCTSDRPELSEINGQRVAIRARTKSHDGTWQYSVSPEGKNGLRFDCMEMELHPAVPKNQVVDERSFAIIRQMLGCFLHEDFDVEFKSIVDALVAALKNTDTVRLGEALRELEAQPDAVIEEVLNDHALHLWDSTSPREFLVTLKTLANLL